MDASALLRISRITRPCMRNKTPVLHGLAKLLLRVSCPKGGRRHDALIVHEVPGGRMALDLNASLEYSLFFRGCHEPEIGNLIRRSVPRGGVCIDVGANVGAHTLVMARAVGPEGRVIALEPHPAICERLRRNVALNELAQVEVVEAALWRTDGTVELHGFARGAFQQGISSLVGEPPADEPRVRVAGASASPARAAGADHRGVHASAAAESPPASELLAVRGITARTLEATCGISRVDLIKIDAEGAEPAILRELDARIESSRPYLIFEYREGSWRKQGESIEPVLARLRALGYALNVVRKDATVPLEGPLPVGCEIYAVPENRPAPATASSAPAFARSGRSP